MNLVALVKSNIFLQKQKRRENVMDIMFTVIGVLFFLLGLSFFGSAVVLGLRKWKRIRKTVKTIGVVIKNETTLGARQFDASPRSNLYQPTGAKLITRRKHPVT